MIHFVLFVNPGSTAATTATTATPGKDMLCDAPKKSFFLLRLTPNHVESDYQKFPVN